MKPEHISILLESAQAFVNAVTSRPFPHELEEYAMDIKALSDAIKLVERGYTDPTTLLIMCRSAEMPYTIPDNDTADSWIDTRDNAIVAAISELDLVTTPRLIVQCGCLRVDWQSLVEASSWQEEMTGPIRTIANYNVKASETRLRLFRQRRATT